MRQMLLVITGVLLLTIAASGQSRKQTAPETFSARAQTKSTGAAGAANIEIHIQSYTADKDRTVVEEGLKFGGYPGFLTALRKAPEVGYVEFAGQKYAIRWARDVADEKRRTIVVVTDKPVYFVGGGAPNAKPREGYEVALIRLVMDPAGVGTGTMAAAARVKPGGETGVQVDDYAEEPIKLATVTRITP